MRAKNAAGRRVELQDSVEGDLARCHRKNKCMMDDLCHHCVPFLWRRHVTERTATTDTSAYMTRPHKSNCINQAFQFVRICCRVNAIKVTAAGTHMCLKIYAWTTGSLEIVIMAATVDLRINDNGSITRGRYMKHAIGAVTEAITLPTWLSAGPTQSLAWRLCGGGWELAECYTHGYCLSAGS